MQALLLWLFQWEYNSNVTLKCTDLEGKLALHVKSKKYIYSRTSRCTVREQMGMKEY